GAARFPRHAAGVRRGCRGRCRRLSSREPPARHAVTSTTRRCHFDRREKSSVGHRKNGFLPSVEMTKVVANGFLPPVQMTRVVAKTEPHENHPCSIHPPCSACGAKAQARWPCEVSMT